MSTDEQKQKWRSSKIANPKLRERKEKNLSRVCFIARTRTMTTYTGATLTNRLLKKWNVFGRMIFRNQQGSGALSRTYMIWSTNVLSDDISRRIKTLNKKKGGPSSAKVTGTKTGALYDTESYACLGCISYTCFLFSFFNRCSITFIFYVFPRQKQEIFFFFSRPDHTRRDERLDNSFLLRCEQQPWSMFVTKRGFLLLGGKEELVEIEA